MSNGTPKGAHTLSPYLVVKDVDAAIAFYEKAFGAVAECRLTIPGAGQTFHAGMRIGDSMFMLGGEMENENCAATSPVKLGGTPVTIHMYAEDVDAAFQKAVAAGAQPLMPPTDMFWGDRYGKLKDPFGHEWSVATQIRELSPEQMQANAEEFFRQMQPVG